MKFLSIALQALLLAPLAPALAEETQFIVHAHDKTTVTWDGVQPLTIQLKDESILTATRGSVGQGRDEVLVSMTLYLPNQTAKFAQADGSTSTVQLYTDVLMRTCLLKAGERTDKACVFAQAPLPYHIERVR